MTREKGEKMTRKEAIEWLERIEERYILNGDEGFDKARKEALHMAIEALQECQREEQRGKTKICLICGARMVSEDEC